MIRFALLLLAFTPLAAAQDKPDARAGHIDVFVSRYVSSSVDLSDFKLNKEELTVVAIYRSGPKDNIRFDFYDAENVRVCGGRVRPDDLVIGEKSRLTFEVKTPDKIKTLKVTRDNR